MKRHVGWTAYAIAWMAATLFWSVASASGAGVSPVQALPYAVLAMGSAAVMGIGIWHLTGRIEWNWRSPAFTGLHALGLVAFCVIYATSWIWLDILRGQWARVVQELPRSPVLIWNLLMGSWLYLMVAGLSYAIRSQQEARAHEAAAAAATLSAQQAQLAALRAQINPHFLFNALHSVGALVTSDPVQADRALERLGDLLRYALHADEQVPLQSELAFTRDYLAFEQLRLGDRLRVTEDVDDVASRTLVPPLLLQPIVENAVRHGIAHRPEGGCIALSARACGSRVEITVVDDGPGPGAGVADGVGLGSTRRRLDALYGASAALSLAPGRDGFAVTLSLPLHPQAEDTEES